MNYSRISGARAPNRINVGYDLEKIVIDDIIWFKTSFRSNEGQFPASVEIDGRPVAIFENNKGGPPHVIDNNCYHAGGNLSKPYDVEEIAGETCIRCPLHRYVISIESGDVFSQGVTFKKDEVTGKLIPTIGDWASQGQKQRVHKSKIDEDGYLLISLNLEGTMNSDNFANMKKCPNR